MNALVDVRFMVDVSSERLERLMGRPDDGSEDWYQESGGKATEWVRENLMDALELTTGEPDVECNC